MGERDERRDRNIPTVIVRPQSRQVWYATFCHGGCVTYGLTMRPFSWECFVRYPHLFVYDVFFSVEKKKHTSLGMFYKRASRWMRSIQRIQNPASIVRYLNVFS